MSLQSVVISKSATGMWQAFHVPSGKITEGRTPEEAQSLMSQDFGLSEDGQFNGAKTSQRFSGLALAVAVFIERPVSDALAVHSGFARLIDLVEGVASIHLGGGCKGCPSSRMTLFSAVKTQLQDRFGEDVIVDVRLATLD